MQQRLKMRAKTSDRIDDNPATIMRRFETFEEKNKSVVEHLQRSGPVYPVSGTDYLQRETPTNCFKVECDGLIDDVYSSVRNAIEAILAKSNAAQNGNYGINQNVEVILRCNHSSTRCNAVSRMDKVI